MQPRRKRPAGITLDDDEVDEDEEDDVEDTEAVGDLPSLVEGLDLDAIIDSGEPVLPSTFEGARITLTWSLPVVQSHAGACSLIRCMCWVLRAQTSWEHKASVACVSRPR